MIFIIAWLFLVVIVLLVVDANRDDEEMQKKMKYSELKPGQDFIIKGRKTPHGFITLEDGLTHYQIDPDTVVNTPHNQMNHIISKKLQDEEE